MLIDPGDEVDVLLGAVREADIHVQAILLTHAHIDHITGVRAAKEALDVPVYLHRDDLFLYEGIVQQGAMFGFKVQVQPPPSTCSTTFRRFTSATTKSACITRPGHCPGGVCLQIGKKGSTATTCSSATRCSPDRSAAPTCPAATTRC